MTNTKTTFWEMKTADGAIRIWKFGAERFEVYRSMNGTGYSRFMGVAKSKHSAMDIAFGRA